MLPAVIVAIKGLDNCVIEGVKRIVLNRSDQFIADVKIKQYDRKNANNMDTELITELQFIFHQNEFEKMSYKEIREIVKNIVAQLSRQKSKIFIMN